MTSGALIKPDAFKRAAIIDAELDWPRGLAIGRIAMLWAAVQEGKGASVAKRRLILEWACVDAKDADRFLELCCKAKSSKDDEGDHIHFLEKRDDGSYYVVGNPEQLQKIDTFKRRASAGGIAKAKKERAAKAAPSTAPGSASSTASSTAPSSASSSAISVPSSFSFSSSLSSSSSTTTTRARARGEPAEVVVVVGEGESPPAVAESCLTPLGLIALWNEHRGELPEVLDGTPERLALAEVRLGERPDPEHWRLAVERLASLPFATGEVTGWLATFDWLIEEPGKTVHVLEGKYDPRKKRGRRGAAPPEDAPPEPQCRACWDTGILNAGRMLDDGPELDSFHCGCEAGHARRDEHGAWDEAKTGEGWKLQPWTSESYVRWQERRF